MHECRWTDAGRRAEGAYLSHDMYTGFITLGTSTVAPPCPHACMHSGPWGEKRDLLCIFDGMRVQNAMLCYAMLCYAMMRVAGAHGSG